MVELSYLDLWESSITYCIAGKCVIFSYIIKFPQKTKNIRLINCTILKGSLGQGIRYKYVFLIKGQLDPSRFKALFDLLFFITISETIFGSRIFFSF